MTFHALPSSRGIYPSAADSLIVSSVSKYTLDALLNFSQRNQLRDQCSARVSSHESLAELKYADQAILANLDWGIDALDEAIQFTTNAETKTARLDHAEKMLQICGLLDTTGSTAGVPNSYLAAWAHLNLAFVWKLRNDDRKATRHMMDMFLADAYYSRVDFAPDLWERLFQPHFLGIMTWYCEQRAKVASGPLDACEDYTFSMDNFDSYSRDGITLSNVLSKVTPEQTEQLQVLERLYQNTLDDHTRKYAAYYKDLLATGQRKVPTMPTADPPVSNEASASFKHRELDIIQEDTEEIRNGSVQANSPERKAASYLKHSRSSSFSSNTSSRHSSRCSTFTRYSGELSRQLFIESKPISRSSSFSTERNSENSSSYSPSQRKKYSKRPRKPKSIANLPKSNSKRLFEIFEEQNVNIPSPSGSQGYLMDSDKEELAELSLDYNVSPDKDESMTDNVVVQKPPKDFVCPITNQLFKDPVTLETGQTYERRAIQEWVDRGNTTCPITRENLVSKTLPQTNYVLKRLVENWMEQHPEHPYESPLVYEISSKSEEFPSASPSGGGGDSWSLIVELKPAILTLSESENLEECEKAVLTIASIWERSEGHAKVEASLTMAGVIEGLVEVLSVSASRDVHNAALSLLSALVINEEFTIHAIVRADPDLDCIVKLVKKGVRNALVLLFQLNVQVEQLSKLDLIPDLVNYIKGVSDDAADETTPFLLWPKTMAVILLEKLLSTSNTNAQKVISLGAVPLLVENLGAEDIEERVCTISILLSCTKVDGRCRNFIATTIELNHILELIISGENSARRLSMLFLSDMLQLNRRTVIVSLLKIVKEKGFLSTMHVLLVYMQNASPDHQLTAASLLLQLDLLNAPRELSIFAEESMAVILSALMNKDMQVKAANLLASLAGRFSFAGSCIMEAWLLKNAGLDHVYDSIMKEGDNVDSENEEQEAASWEFNAAWTILGYENGTVLRLLSIHLQSKNLELSKPCMIAAIWLSRMIGLLPDMGLRSSACSSFLTSFLVFLESSQHNQQRALAALGLHTFLSTSESLQELLCYAKDIIKPLRQLKKVTWIAQDFIAAFISNTSIDQIDIWQHGQVGMVDGRSGEVRALAQSKGRLYSGHSDGTIQVWDTRKKLPTLVVALKDHTKAVTCLTLSSNRLYSGSLDKTVRVWTIAPDSVLCVNTLDMKDGIHGIACDRSIFSIATFNNGIKVQSENFSTKYMNTSKHVQCMSISNGKIYCGCSDSSIQEVDIEDGSAVAIQSGTRSLLGKRPMYAIQVFKSEIFTAGSVSEGAPVKIWSQADRSLLKTVPTSSDIRALVCSDDFLYLGSSTGLVEVWLKNKLIKVSTVSVGSKVNAVVLNKDTLYCGCEDGKIRVISM